MRTIHLGDVEVKAQGSPWAIFLYQREFSTPDKPCSWYDDYESTTATPMESTAEDEKVRREENVVYSVEALDCMFCLRTLWACAACHDERNTPPFETWLKSMSEKTAISMAKFSLWKLEVSALINAEIFRFGPQAKQEETEGSTAARE